MPAPAMAAIGVQREPKIDNLRARVRSYGSGASMKSGRLITLGINCSTRFADLEILFLLLNIVLCLRSAEARRLETDSAEALPGDIKTGVC